MAYLTEYAAGPSDPVWEETKGVLERGRYRIERALDPDQRWVLRIHRSGALEAEEAPSGPHASKKGAKAWAQHYDIESLRHLKLFRHAVLAPIFLLAAFAVYYVALPADSNVAIAAVIAALLLAHIGIRELVWFAATILTASSDEDLRASTTVVDRAVVRVVRSLMRPVDEAPETGVQVRIVEDWDGSAQG
ncbi:MAG: hypothetical protein ACR2NG_01870 [Acidimicrobiia bacterium]